MKLADFGLSHMNPELAFIPFHPGGTLEYQSPETLMSKYISNEADVWALGVMGYEICTLKHPFLSIREDRGKPMEAIKRGNVPTINSEGGKYSEELRDVISLMLQKEPEGRIYLAHLHQALYANVSPHPHINVIAFSSSSSSTYSSSSHNSTPTVSTSDEPEPEEGDNQSVTPDQLSVKSSDSNSFSSIASKSLSHAMGITVIDEDQDGAKKRREDEVGMHLRRAVLNEDEAIVNALIGGGCDVNGSDENGVTALHLAAYNGCIPIMEYLVKSGGAVNKKDEYGWNGIHIASQEGHLSMVEYLLNHGGEINARTSNGLNGVMIASLRGHLDIVRYLVEHGGEINGTATNGWNGIMIASQTGHLDVVKYLVERGGDVNCINKDGGNAVMLASYKGHLDIVQYLVEHGGDVKEKR